MIEKDSLELNKRRKTAIDPCPFIAFLLTFAALSLVFLMTDIAPFGNRTVFMSDLADQYAPYLIGLRNKILNGSSLSYSFGLGMGKNTAGIFAYYLSSPLNLLILAFPASHVSEAIVILIMLKLSFSGAFMTLFLGRKFREKNRMCILFGLVYALSAFPLTFSFNFIWLDGYALLPLILHLTERFREDRKQVWKLLVALVVLMVSNYYIAYMVGIFSFIYLLGILEYEQNVLPHIDLDSRTDGEKSVPGKDRMSPGKTVGWFILTAVCAAMISAAVLVPAGLDTLRNGDNSSQLEMNMEPIFPLRKILMQFFPHSFQSLSNNLPIFYSSLLVTLLLVLLFCNRSIASKVKIRIGCAIGAAILCFVFPPLDLAWQLFNMPNWFMHRYSFLLTFVLVVAAYYSFLHLKNLTTKEFAAGFGIFTVLLCMSEPLAGLEASESKFFQNLFLAALIAVLLLAVTKEKWPKQIADLRRYGNGILAAVIAFEIVILIPQMTVGHLYGGTQKVSAFSADLSDITSLTSIAKEKQWGRVEQDGDLNSNIKSLSLSAYTTTNGIGSFCTMANKQQHHFLKQLGYKANYNYYALEHISLILPPDSILGVRYILSEKSEITGLNRIGQAGKYSLFENPYAANIAMLVPDSAYSFEGYALEKALKNKDYFLFQEFWIESLTGQDAQALFEQKKPEFTVVNAEETEKETYDLFLSYNRTKDALNYEDLNEGPKYTKYYLRKNDKAPIVLSTEVVVEKEAPMYFVIPFQMYNAPAEVYCNGEKIHAEEFASYYSVILSLGSHKAGEKLELEIRCDDDIYASFAPIVAYLDLEVLDAQMKILNEGISDVHVSDGKVGFVAEAKENQMIITTVPFEDGWTVTVDGQKVQYSAYQDAFICFSVSSGTHSIEMRYNSPGQTVGVIISAAGLLAAALVIVCLRKGPKEEKEAAREERHD